jgi:hypothetical protein
MAKKQSRRKKNAPKEPENKKEGNAFDKIFKEMAHSIFRPLVEERLGIKIKKFRPLREKMQTTIEREMDFFYEVTTDTNDVFTLHLEFESTDNLEMVYRVGEYHGIQLRRRQKPMRHVVIYLGMEPPKMRTQLRPEEIYTGFELVNVHGLNTAVLLSSQIPDMVLVAILSDYPIEHAESVLRLIVQKLKVLAKNESELTKFLSQLVMLSRLRKIEELTIKITEEMPITIGIETDYLYNKGIEKGIEKGMTKKDYENKYNFVMSLFQNSDFSIEKIALIASVDVAFVEKIKLELQHKKG